MIKTFEGYRKPYILVGNHDRINEKNQAHALEFLRPHARIIDAPTPISELDIVFFPYSHDVEELKADLKNWARAGDTLVMHQGVTAADKGDYIVDKSAIDVELLSNYTVFSGHYHKHQTIGTCTYIGNPFTMSFGEAKDGPKGFLILYSDGTFTRKTLDYRKHVVIECSYDQILYSSSGMFDNLKPNDLVWLKISGPISELNKIKKSELAREIGHMNFKLDKIATEVQQLQETNIPKTDQQILDELIDSSAESADQKKRLKNLWREVIQ
jgi:DNA repair exonuclease SbcCD nuclease subunit